MMGEECSGVSSSTSMATNEGFCFRVDLDRLGIRLKIRISSRSRILRGATDSGKGSGKSESLKEE